MKRKRMPRRMRIVFGIAVAMVMAGVLPWAAAQQPGNYGATSSGSKSESKEAIKNVPRLQAKRVLTVTGNEDWDALTGFGKDASMAEMMILMMVGGSGMEHMKMGPMKPGNMNGMNRGAAWQPGGLPMTVTITPNPPVVGENALDIVVLDTNGKPVTGLKLSASVNMTSMDMGTARPKVGAGKNGHYTIAVNFSMKGPWQVILTIAPPKQKPFSRSFDFHVAE